MMLLRYKINIFIFLIIFSLGKDIFAAGLYVGAGFYSMSAKVGSSKTSVSSPSAFSFIYTKSFFSHTSLEIGYNFLFEKLTGGDVSFGPNLGIRYYHFGNSTNLVSHQDGLSIQVKKSYNPYVSVGFTQKEFQSIKSSYSGFYLGGGVEVGWKKNFSFFGDAKYSSLSGPVKGSATELTTIVGIIYHDI